MKLKEITALIEELCPLFLQECYDNSGLSLGEPNQEITKALICTDITEQIVDEAIEIGANLIISHHPAIFQGIKKINTSTTFGRILQKSIQHNIAWYSAHTNLDNVIDGVNSVIADKLGLTNRQVLNPMKSVYGKLQVYVPNSHANTLAKALALVGCGRYRNYDSCRWETQGFGYFRAIGNAQPYVGNLNELQKKEECKLELIYPLFKTSQVISTIIENHPYEEVAYDLLPLENTFTNFGSGIIGYLEKELSEIEFLDKLKEITNASGIKHSKLSGKKIVKVALCGGSGGFLIKNALSNMADVFVTGEIKYHDFVDNNKSILLVDAGHYETEQYTKILLSEYITKKIPNFAVQISDREENPICYY